MEISPEIKSSLRTLVAGIGSYAVGKGWITLEMLGMYSDAIVILIIAIVGGWGIWAKRPKSGEAQQVAQKVADDPDVPNPLRASGKEMQ